MLIPDRFAQSLVLPGWIRSTSSVSWCCLSGDPRESILGEKRRIVQSG